MDSISSFLSVNPAVFTVLAVLVVIMILFFILKKLIKDPGSMSCKIRQATQTLKAGKDQIGETFSSLFEDTKSLGGKISKVPGDLNKMLKSADEDAEKEFKKK